MRTVPTFCNAFVDPLDPNLNSRQDTLLVEFVSLAPSVSLCLCLSYLRVQCMSIWKGIMWDGAQQEEELR